MRQIGEQPRSSSSSGIGAIPAVAAAGATVLLWASAFPGIRAGLQAYSPTHVALLRYGVASGVLGVYALVTRMPAPRWRDVPGITLTGAVGISLYNVALNAGEVSVPSAVASFIVASAPVFMTVEARVFLGERVGSWGWMGIVLSFLGVATISLGTGHGLAVDPRALLILVAAIAQSAYFVAQKPYLRRYSPVQYTTYAVWAGTLLLLLFTPGLPEELRQAPASATIAVLYLGAFPGALGYVLWAFALARMSAATTGSFLYLVPVCASIIAWFWLRELASALSLVGGVVIISGVLLVNTLGRVSQSAPTQARTQEQGSIFITRADPSQPSSAQGIN